MTLNPDLIDQSQEWADSVHRDMLAATLLDPNMIAFRSAALDVPEAIINLVDTAMK